MVLKTRSKIAGAAGTSLLLALSMTGVTAAWGSEAETENDSITYLYLPGDTLGDALERAIDRSGAKSVSEHLSAASPEQLQSMLPEKAGVSFSTGDGALLADWAISGFSNSTRAENLLEREASPVEVAKNLTGSTTSLGDAGEVHPNTGSAAANSAPIPPGFVIWGDVLNPDQPYAWVMSYEIILINCQFAGFFCDVDERGDFRHTISPAATSTFVNTIYTQFNPDGGPVDRIGSTTVDYYKYNGEFIGDESTDPLAPTGWGRGVREVIDHPSMVTGGPSRTVIVNSTYIDGNLETVRLATAPEITPANGLTYYTGIDF